MSISSIERYREWAQKIEKDPLFTAELMKLEFADDLVRLLEARGLKRTELAERLGTNRGYVTRVLNTEYNLSVETMAKIALALDARISLRMHPREEAERRPRSSTPSRTVRRREREHEFIASDKPARVRQSRKP
ncbi:helix-turn-helix transcriptional regulator [candidate division WOR-3 bacterium]|nr:helix-turn-helix transcriptional regulator [candidate division WOR-3 bacterium]